MPSATPKPGRSLADLHPDITAQWHPTKNGDLRPDQVVAGSDKRVWWVCDKGPDHEWQATVNSRTAGHGCPMCAGRSISLTNSLAVLHPDIAAQWHPTLNGSLVPDDVTIKSNKTIWWKCDEGPDHEWQARVAYRTADHGCPMCRGKKASVTNSLASLHPDIAAQWHPTRNGELTPDQVPAGSSKSVWWVCDKGPDHEWQAPVTERMTGHGCSMCAGKQVSVTNSLAARFPQVAADWHPTRNGDLTPDQVTAASGKKHWWVCGKGPDHEWDATIGSRTRGAACPMCAGQRPSVTNSLAALNPSVAAQWHPTKNGDLTPDQVVAGAKRKVWWVCDKGPDHEWQAVVSNRTSNGTGCPMCAGLAVSVTNSLASLYPEVAAQWHPTRNGELTPDDVIAGAHTKVAWKCDNGSDHEWVATVGSRTAGAGCPMCRGLRVSVTNSLASLRPDIAAEWHPTKNGDLTPDQVVARSNRKHWWVCDQGPDHEWQASADSRVRDRGCPMCAGKMVSVTNSLASLYPEVAAQWHPTENGDLVPDQVTAGSNKKVWWTCPVDPRHAWRATPSDRTSKGSGCPDCSVRPRSMAELRIAYELATLTPLNPDEHRVESGRWTLDCDIVAPNHNLVIEYDAAHWHKRMARDLKKTKRLHDAGWRVLRIREAPLEPISPLDVVVPLGAAPKKVVDLVLPRLVELGLVTQADADAYLQRTGLVAEEESLAAIRAIQAKRAAGRKSSSIAK